MLRERLALRREPPRDETTVPLERVPALAPGPSTKVSRDPLVGMTLGHFRVEAPIGHGGMGVVYRAWDTSLERPVALKALLSEGAAPRARFLREARTQARLRHQNVVPIHFVGDGQRPDGRALAYIVMELVDGGSLAGLLHHEGPVDQDRALDLVDAVASALEAAQTGGLVHRDIKPSNVLLDSAGRVLLADFGLAKEVTADDPVDGTRPLPMAGAIDLTKAGVIMGTPAYMAPEQARGERVDHRADIYALGVTLYELLTGNPPFTARSNSVVLAQHQAQVARPPNMVRPELRPKVTALVMRMLAKKPEARFETYEDLRAAIADARPRPVGPASFFPRASAFIIDLLVLGLLSGLARFLYVPVWLAPVVVVCMGGLVEASWGGTTPGKRVMRLKTVDASGNTPGRARSVARALLKFWFLIAGNLASRLPVMPGLKASLTVDGKPIPLQVSNGLLIFVLWVLTMFVALGKRRATLHDRVSKTRVVSVLDE